MPISTNITIRTQNWNWTHIMTHAFLNLALVLVKIFGIYEPPAVFEFSLSYVPDVRRPGGVSQLGCYSSVYFYVSKFVISLACVVFTMFLVHFWSELCRPRTFGPSKVSKPPSEGNQFDPEGSCGRHFCYLIFNFGTQNPEIFDKSSLIPIPKTIIYLLVYAHRVFRLSPDKLCRTSVLDWSR